MSDSGTQSASAEGSGRGGRQSHGGRGRGHERGGRGGRGGGTSGSAFKENTEGMNGHVFQCFNETLEKKQFARTLEALAEYVAKNMDYPGDLNSVFKSLTKPKIASPEELTDEEAKSKLKMTIWEKQVATYCKRLDFLDSNLKALHAVIWGQCSKAMRAKLSLLETSKQKTIKRLHLASEGDQGHHVPV